jgi:Ni/Co efflux regulator RcnB
MKGTSTVRKIILGLVAATLVASPLAMSAQANAATRSFANCTAMHKVYKHGVAKSSTAAARQVRAGYGRPPSSRSSTEPMSRATADKDGTACEA